MQPAVNEINSGVWGKKIEGKKQQNGSKTTQKPRRDDNEQLKYDLTVLFSSIFIFNPWEWVTCDSSQMQMSGISYTGVYFISECIFNIRIIIIRNKTTSSPKQTLF